MKICVIGGGYVGLPTAACLAESGNTITCAEKTPEKLSSLRQGQATIFEPGLQELFDRNIAAGRLNFVSHVHEAGPCDIYLIAVGTPSLANGKADLRYVEAAVRECVQAASINEALIVIKSTVPVGTTEKMRDVVKQELAASKKSIQIDIAFNPEFLKQGKAVQDTIYPDRIVIGIENERSLKKLRRLYKPFNRAGEKIMAMDIASAEMTKYAANCMLATRISFMNELAQLCEACGADIDAVRRGIGSDKRIGKSFLYAGIGYGGSCFPKDVQAIVQLAQEKGINFGILGAVHERNLEQKELFLQKIRKAYGQNLHQQTFAVWGLSFKPETDDLRESPAIGIIQTLLREGVKIQAFDPVAIPNTKKKFEHDSPELLKNLEFVSEQYQALQNADALLLLTEWKEFSSPDFQKIASELKKKTIFDGRNQYDAAELAGHGLSYVPVGKPASWI